MTWRSCRCHVLNVLVWKQRDAFVGVLVPRSCKVLPSSRSFYDDLAGFCSGSWHEDIVLVKRSCGDPSGTLSQAFAWFCTGPCEKLSTSLHDGIGPCEKICLRSCWSSPEDVLALRFWRSFASVFYETSYGMLIGSSCLEILRVLISMYRFDLQARSCCCCKCDHA